MTHPGATPKPLSFKDWAAAIAAQIVTIGSAITIIATLAWAVAGAFITDQARILAGTDDILVRVERAAKVGIENGAAIKANTAEISNLTRAVQVASGEHLVVRELQGFSYVREPVHVDDPFVHLHMVLGRTETWKECIFVGGSAVFADSVGNQRSSDTIIAPRSMLGTTPVPLDLSLRKPPDLLPGRTLVWLALQHECEVVDVIDGVSVIRVVTKFTETSRVAFNLLPPKFAPPIPGPAVSQ